jgi:hypothetical protein
VSTAAFTLLAAVQPTLRVSDQVVDNPVGLAAGVAILRYRLYEIDRLLNRTLVYGLVTVLLAGVYAGLVLLLGQLSGGVADGTPSWVVAGATLAVAALFQPARRRIQAVVDQTVQPTRASLWLRS